MQEFTVNQALKYLEGNPEENIPKLMAWVDRLMPKDWYVSQEKCDPRGDRAEEQLVSVNLEAL